MVNNDKTFLKLMAKHSAEDHTSSKVSKHESKPDWQWVPSTGICHKFYSMIMIILKYKNKDVIKLSSLTKILK